MFQGLSRRTLNALIIVCLLIITGINLGFRTDEDTPLEPVDAAPLADTGWHRWQSREGIPVYWQASAGDTLNVVVSGDRQYSLRTGVDASNWAEALSQSDLGTAGPARSAAIALQGPLTGDEMQQAAAFIIRRLSLTAPPRNTYKCQLEFPAGALWYARLQGLGVAAPVSVATKDMKQAAPTRDDWQTFRQSEIKRMRSEWLSASAAIDIAADLAYHRWPENYYSALYQALAQSQRTAPLDFATCQSHSSGAADRR